MLRKDNRQWNQLRPVEMFVGFQRNAEGSVLYRAGNTVVLCTVSIDMAVPPWMAGKGVGWLTAEYQMHPRANVSRRESRDGRGKSLSGRTQEIQRLIGRSLRAAVNLNLLGERTLMIDCDVLEADGGTRTAAITGSFVALALAISRVDEGALLKNGIILDAIAATSVGKLDSGIALDLNYAEDSTAHVDMNVVAATDEKLIEVQSTAEKNTMKRNEMDAMLDLALSGIASLRKLQRQTLANAGVDTSWFDETR